MIPFEYVLIHPLDQPELERMFSRNGRVMIPVFGCGCNYVSMPVLVDYAHERGVVSWVCGDRVRQFLLVTS